MTLAQLRFLRDIARRARFWIARRRGNAHTVSVRDTALSNTDSVVLTLENPPDSNTTLTVHGVEATGTGTLDVTLYDQFDTDPAGGTVPTTDNMLLDTAANGSSQATVRRGDTFVASNEHYVSISAGGGPAGTAVGESHNATRPMIEPGRTLVCEIVNRSGGEIRAALGITWSEAKEIPSQQ